MKHLLAKEQNFHERKRKKHAGEGSREKSRKQSVISVNKEVYSEKREKRPVHSAKLGMERPSRARQQAVVSASAPSRSAALFAGKM
jgi:hypothetical protein